jgi:hypothetical protein
LDEYLAFFKNQGITNVELEKSNSFPIYALLENIDHHVTYMSTVAFEASAFSKPTTIIHPVGQANFAEFIEQGLFSYAPTSAQLIDSITNPVREFDKAKKILNITSDQSEIAFQKIAQDAKIQCGLNHI